jgi:hypothetical protein
MRFAAVTEQPPTIVRRIGFEEMGVDPMTGETVFRDHAIIVGKDGSVVCSMHGSACAFAIENRTAEFVQRYGPTGAGE